MLQRNEVTDNVYGLLNEANSALQLAFKNLDRRKATTACEFLYKAESLIEEARENLEGDNDGSES